MLGIEPCKSVAEKAIKKGIKTDINFFDKIYAKKNFTNNTSKGDLVIANNVLAHVPDIKSFVKGITYIIKNNGICTIEFPSVSNLIKDLQFDTIYHEHYSYLSLNFVKLLFSNVNMRLFNVDEIPTHGGSYRAYFCLENAKYQTSSLVDELLKEEIKSGIFDNSYLVEFQRKVVKLKMKTMKLLLSLKENNKEIIGYGAAAKASTITNYLGLDSSIISYIVDKNVYKQNKYLPGSRILVLDPKQIFKTKPDYIIIFPWNIKDEIISQISPKINWECKFITILPDNSIIKCK